MNLKYAFEAHPADRPIPRIAVKIKSFERDEMYIPGVTNRLALFSDATGEMLGTIQQSILTEYFTTFVPNSVVILKNVPIFNRSRFHRQLLVGKACIEEIFPELEEDDEDRMRIKHARESAAKQTTTTSSSSSSPSTFPEPQNPPSFGSRTGSTSLSYSTQRDLNALTQADESDESDEDFETNSVPFKKKNPSLSEKVSPISSKASSPSARAFPVQDPSGIEEASTPSSIAPIPSPSSSAIQQSSRSDSTPPHPQTSLSPSGLASLTPVRSSPSTAAVSTPSSVQNRSQLQTLSQFSFSFTQHFSQVPPGGTQAHSQLDPAAPPTALGLASQPSLFESQVPSQLPRGLDSDLYIFDEEEDADGSAMEAQGEDPSLVSTLKSTTIHRGESNPEASADQPFTTEKRGDVMLDQDDYGSKSSSSKSPNKAELDLSSFQAPQSATKISRGIDLIESFRSESSESLDSSSFLSSLSKRGSKR